MMEEYSRPATIEDLKALILSLNKQGADYLLIGGYALFAHGYHRATTDIDILVPATLESGQKIRNAMMVLSDQAARDIDPAWFEEGENIRVADVFVVDIMLPHPHGQPGRLATHKTDHARQRRGRQGYPGTSFGSRPCPTQEAQTLRPRIGCDWQWYVSQPLPR